MTAKFAGATRFSLGVVNLPHTRRGTSDGSRAAKLVRGAKGCVSGRSNPLSPLFRAPWRCAGQVSQALTNHHAPLDTPSWWRDSDAHEQQVSHQRQPALLHVLRRAVPPPRWLRRSLAHVRRAALLLGVLRRRRRGSAVSKAPLRPQPPSTQPVPPTFEAAARPATRP